MSALRGLASRLPRPATVVAVIALCLSASAGATAATLITGSAIKDGSLTGADIKRGSIGARDLSRSARRDLRGARGPAGPPGVAGQRGAPGQSGSAAPSGVLVAAESHVQVRAAEGQKTVAELILPPGSFILDATMTVRSQGGGDACALASSDGTLQALQFTVNDNDGDQVLLQGELDNTRPVTRVRVSCTADDQLEVEDARIRAVQVEQLG